MQKFFPVFILLLVISACSSQKIQLSEEDRKAITEQSNHTKNTPQQLLIQFESKQSVLGEELAFYAPIHYQLATEKYEIAKTIIIQNVESKKAHFEISSALHLLDIASQNKSAIKLHLKKADSQYSELLKLATPSLLPAKFNKLKEDYKDLIHMIEKGRVQDAIKQEKDLIDNMIKLEIETLIQAHLSESESLLAKANKLNAEDYMPNNLYLLETSLSDIKSFITKSYRDRQAIKKRSEELEKKVRKLFFIVEEANLIQKSNDIEIGKYARSKFETINKIASAMSIDNIEIAAYANMLEKLITELKTYKKDIAIKTDAFTSEVKMQESKTIEQKDKNPDFTNNIQTTISPEINKAVLTELINTNSDLELESEEENLEFDSVEMVQ